MDTNNKNISNTQVGQTVIIGRMKGNISVNDKIYKMSSKSLSTSAKESFKKENKKIALNCSVTIKKNKPISITITSANMLELYKDLNITYEINELPSEAQNKPLTPEIIIQQISKTASTPYVFNNIYIDLDNNVFLPKISLLNELRREGLNHVQDFIAAKCFRYK